ncbi:AAA family ATPase [Streptomyces griseoviridis]|uniref:DNA-binding CsgD family transcriptional regulator n=1 Tax=Streptomyces griseoviridis TaxID=45398 RepID=A0ABT9L9B4_STRGD|nr:LuxR family transcriptional regulator [Streptomyces griseoviridis]MDP9680289.1 DNA-binding CsgD family transcriptional regulator [Streptomyces griseoviridis]GGT09691.1 transcriptional regulator [Streptomyces griseoviridis]
MTPDGDAARLPLIGRVTELAAIGAFLERARGSGGVMTVHGELGSGKSALLREGRRAAEAAGHAVIPVRGHRTEAGLSGAGLTQLVPAPVGGPDVRGAAAEALARLARAGRPLLVVLDDAQWFDSLSLEALLTACREAGGALLLASRPVGPEGARPTSEPAPDLVLGPLAGADAERLLRRYGPDVPPLLASRVLREAGGNPAGLVSVTGLLASSPPPAEALLAPRLPLGEALHTRVTRLLAGVPEPVRDALLLAAVADTGRPDLLREAARAVDPSGHALETAEARGLLLREAGTVRFGHPLLCSAVYWAASRAQRRRAHLALAERDEPGAYRRALHRALASAAPDEATARELEAGVPGDLPEAAAVHELAADLSPRPVDRARGLVRAAWAAQVRDQTGELRRLVARITTLSAGQCPETAAAVAALGPLGAAGEPAVPWPPFPPPAAGPAPCGLSAPRVSGARPPDTRHDRSPSPLSALCWTDRTAHADRGRALLRTAGAALARGRFPVEPLHGAAVVSVATALDDPLAAERLGGAVLESLTGHGYFGTARAVLVHRQLARLHLGDREGVLRDAGTGERWSRAADDPHAAAVFRCGVAQVRAWEGAEEGHAALTDGILAFALPRGLPLPASRARWARGLMALAHGRPEDAYEELRMLSDPGGDARHPVVAAWALGDLVAAAVASRRGDAVRDRVRWAAEVNRSLRSAPLEHLLARSLALLGEGDAPEEHFTRALAVPGTGALRYERARTRLAFGEWLRRRRRVLEARDQLQRARDGFASAGARVWARRADSELLAAGDATAADPLRFTAGFGLTPREAEVARLAARGLSNQGIGWQLGLTHRTVASHLSRVFAKAGVTSRKQLPAVLGIGI